MKPSHLKKAIKQCYKARRPYIVWSPPGSGKSQIQAQVCKELGIDLIDRRTADQDPVDLGLPKLNGNTHGFTTPDFLPTTGNGILFLDEFPQAIPAVKNTWSEIILDRRLRSYTLPDGWSIGAAGNLEGDNCATHKMPKHILNRFIHLYLDIDVDEWIDHALTANFHMDAVFFIKHRPDLVYKFDPQADDKAYPTLRSWEYVSDLIATDPDPDIELDLLSGIIGEGAAAEFYGFRRIKDQLVSPDVILMNPAAADVPTDPAALFALSASLAGQTTDQTIDRITEYSNRMPKEFNVFLMASAVTRNPELVNTKAYVLWNQTNKDVII